MLASARETVEKSKKVWDVYNPDVHCKECNICSTFDTTSKGAKKQKKSIGDVSSDSVSAFSDGNVFTIESSFEVPRMRATDKKAKDKSLEKLADQTIKWACMIIERPIINVFTHVLISNNVVVVCYAF